MPLKDDGFGVSVKRSFAGLRRAFFIPPFTVLRVMDGRWMTRKRAWLRLGIKSELGRGEENLLKMSEAANRQQCEGSKNKNKNKNTGAFAGAMGLVLGRPCDLRGSYKRLNKAQRKAEVHGLTFRATGFMAEEMLKRGGGTSIFDPVLCELMYRWFCPVGGQVIDPFAGGSVRGIVASVLDFRYWGSELRPEQVESNREQAKEIVPDNQPVWACGDAAEVLSDAPEADFIFSCPPYGNLGKYSELTGDLSNMTYSEFRIAYRDIITKSVGRLRDNRFACFVVSNFRDENGFYNDLVGDTVRAFRRAGMSYYNEAVLVTATGSLPIRVGRQFQAGRKLGKTHQNVLVFYKGDPKRIKDEFGLLDHNAEENGDEGGEEEEIEDAEV